MHELPRYTDDQIVKLLSKTSDGEFLYLMFHKNLPIIEANWLKRQLGSKESSCSSIMRLCDDMKHSLVNGQPITSHLKNLAEIIVFREDKFPRMDSESRGQYLFAQEIYWLVAPGRPNLVQNICSEIIEVLELSLKLPTDNESHRYTQARVKRLYSLYSMMKGSLFEDLHERLLNSPLKQSWPTMPLVTLSNRA